MVERTENTFRTSTSELRLKRFCPYNSLIQRRRRQLFPRQSRILKEWVSIERTKDSRLALCSQRSIVSSLCHQLTESIQLLLIYNSYWLVIEQTSLHDHAFFLEKCKGFIDSGKNLCSSLRNKWRRCHLGFPYNIDLFGMLKCVLKFALNSA